MITLSGVTKLFDGVPALDNADLEIPTGVSYGLLGSNGAGKSTLLRLISGTYRSDGGKVLIDGEEIFDNARVREKVFFINDETVQFGRFTLKELKNFYKGYYPKFSDEVFDELAKKVQLPMDKRTDKFSKGMKRQSIVITGLACRTDYLLLDEAFDGLDPTMRIIVKRMLVDAILDRGLTTVISSHNLKEINEVCDTVALLHKGRIVFNRDLDSVKGNIHKVQAAFPENRSKEDFVSPNILHFDKNGSVCHIIMRGDENMIKEYLAPYSPMFLDIIPMTLEEIFIYEMEGLGYKADEITEGGEAL
ncbi:MAG: ABC transporter ATP-binding protein [Oscillospiraceae bacterium]|nr:ABC transporter ATP-binding protein [Oscillospiraceae bacterium]